MTFRDEVFGWFDRFGMMGRRAGAQPGEEGNPLTETGTVWLAMRKLDQVDEAIDPGLFSAALARVELQPGLYAHKMQPDGSVSPDELTHDDIIGVVAGSLALGTRHAADVAGYGIRNGWLFSSTGQPYFTAFAKPWHIAYYTLAAGLRPAIWDLLSLCLSVALNALLAPDDASGKRLTWLIVESIRGRSRLVDMAGDFWAWRIRKAYGGMRRVFIMFHGEHHPLARWYPDQMV